MYFNDRCDASHKKTTSKKIIEILLTNMRPNSIFIYKDISNENFIFSYMNFFHDLFYNFEYINYFESKKILDIARYNNLNVKQFKKRILWYDHEFLIIKS